MALKQFQTQDGVKISSTPGSIQIVDQTISSGDQVNIQVGSNLHWAAYQYHSDGGNGYGIWPVAVKYDNLGNLLSIQNVRGGDNEGSTITKYNNLGTILWQRQLINAYPNTLTVDGANNAYVLLDYDGESLSVIKLSGTDGSILWQRQLMMDYGVEQFGCTVNNSGELIITGGSRITTENDRYSLALAKMNTSTGSVVWYKEVSSVNALSGRDVSCDSVGNIYVVGWWQDTTTNRNRVIALKFNSSGSIVWQKYIPSEYDADNYSVNVRCDPYGDVYLTANWYVPNPNFDNSGADGVQTLLIKLSGSGSTLWSRKIGPGPCYSVATGLAVDQDGDVYLSGVTFTNTNPYDNDEWNQFYNSVNRIIVARYSPTGAVKWRRYISGDRLNMWRDVTSDIPLTKGTMLDVRNQLVAHVSTQNHAVQFFDSAVDQGFVCQFPADGDEWDIGPLKLAEARVPGKQVSISLVDTDFSLDEAEVVTSASAWSLSTPTVGNQTLTQNSFDFEFTGAGTLRIPNEGDLELTQHTQGWITIYGPLINNSDDIEWYGVDGDEDGNAYLTGLDASSSTATITKIDAQGAVAWSLLTSHDSTNTIGAAVLADIYEDLLVHLVNQTDLNRISILIQNMLTGSITQNSVIYDNQDSRPVIANDMQATSATAVVVGRVIDPTLGLEALVWQPGWGKTVGGGQPGADDEFLGVALLPDLKVVAVGYGVGGAEGLTDTLATVALFDTAGTLVWSKVLNPTDVFCKAFSVAADATQIVVSWYNDSTENSYLTCMDFDGEVQWTQQTPGGSNSSSITIDQAGDVYWAVQAYWDEIVDDAIKVIRLSSTGQTIWKTWLGNRNDTRMRGAKSIAVKGNSIWVAGYTDDTDNDYDTAFGAKLGKDGESLGDYGHYFWVRGTYDVQPFAVTPTPWTPVVSTIALTQEIDPDTGVSWYQRDNNVELIRDSDGGAVVFGDGSRQTTSATDIPRSVAGSGERRIGMVDRGKHIYVPLDGNEESLDIIVPYDYDVPMPIGSTVVIVNNSGTTIVIRVDGASTSLIVPGLGSNQNYTLSNQGMATLLKVDVETWFMTGATIEVQP